MSADPEELTTERLEADIAYLAMEIERCMGRWLALVAEFDRREAAPAAGFRGTAEWLAWRCGLDLRTARDHVRVARRLEEWSEMRAAHAAGELSYSKLRALSRAPVDADQLALVERARTVTAARLEQTVRSLRSGPSADVDVVNAAHEKRYLEWHWDDDGSLRIHGRLGPDEGAALIEALETAAELLHPTPAPEQDGDHVAPRPPLKARRADALTEVVHSGSPRAAVVLHVDMEALACTASGSEPRAGETCALEGGPAVPSETARRLTCDAEIVTDEGRRRRVVSPPLRRALERRDRCCRFPGCDRRHGLHAHHLQHWAHGGRTDRDNLGLFCRFHHRLLHEGGFSAAREPSGELVVRRQDGRAVTEVPPQPLSVQKPSAPTWRSVATRPSSSRASARSMSQTVATSAVASGVPAQASTSSTEEGGSRRSTPGTRFAKTTSYAAKGWKPGTEIVVPSERRVIS